MAAQRREAPAAIESITQFLVGLPEALELFQRVGVRASFEIDRREAARRAFGGAGLQQGLVDAPC